MNPLMGMLGLGGAGGMLGGLTMEQLLENLKKKKRGVSVEPPTGISGMARQGANAGDVSIPAIAKLFMGG